MNNTQQQPGFLSAAIALFVRDLRLAARRSTDVLNPLVFFVIVVSLFPLGVGPEPNQLQLLAPGVIWVAALLATMISLDRIFSHDYETGSLEQIALAPQSLTILVFAKTVAHWTLTGLPLVILTPIVAIQMNMTPEMIKISFLSLLIGTPVLSLIGAIGAGLTIGLRGGGVLVSLLVLPLYTPVLIFGAGAITASAQGFSPDAHLSILSALLALSLTLAPFATAAAVRVSID